MESDADFRRRIILAPEGYSVAGPEGAYIFHALSADPDVLDASATSPTPGEVVVTVLSRTGDGTAPPELLATVEAAGSADDVRRGCQPSDAGKPRRRCRADADAGGALHRCHPQLRRDR